jgi:hypothetical protein
MAHRGGLLSPGIAAALLAGVACVGGTEDNGPLSPEASAELRSIAEELDATADWTTEDLLDRYSTPQTDEIDYDPFEAENYDLIRDSFFEPRAEDEAVLEERGFVISEHRRFPSFLYGYETVYAEDLPVYITADAVLHGLQSSFSDILEVLEETALAPDLLTLLERMRGPRFGNRAAAAYSQQVQSDLDIYLAVAMALMSEQTPSLRDVHGDDWANVQRRVYDLIDRILRADGQHRVELFGTERTVDFSQFEPRAHYTGSPALQRYFRAMTWLNRIDFRIVETQPDHELRLQRRQLESVLAMRALIDDEGFEIWARISDTIGAFIGEPDHMTLREVDPLRSDLGVRGPAGLERMSDEDIRRVILRGGYGTQRISSHIMVNGRPSEGTLPLSSSFALFGSRYIVDSHVFSNLVFDRVGDGSIYRLLPDPLDVAFAALGNDQAAALLDSELEEYGHAADLHATRFLVDQHPADFWSANLYNRWLTALRALSPTAELTDPEAAGLPSLFATEAWGRRMLNTQMASWAELRHATLLYAKQSYTAVKPCEFPDAYVDPYPDFYRAVADLARDGLAAADMFDGDENASVLTPIREYFAELESVAETLAEMADHQRTGEPLNREHMAFINDAVRVSEGCVGILDADGWLARLYFRRDEGAQWDPVVADVHTKPSTAGSPLPKVLHVGTGGPRAMVVTVPTCQGPRAYVGLVSSYFERITIGERASQIERLNDERWKEDIEAERPADVPWMSDLVVR